MNKIILTVLTVICSFSLVGVSAVSAAQDNSAGMKGAGKDIRNIVRNKMQNRIQLMAPEDREAMKSEHQSLQAQILGITVEELQAKIESGLHIPEIAAELGISMEDVRAKMREQAEQKMRERLGQLVDDGKITEEQAQKRLENIKRKAENIDKTDPEKMRARNDERLQKGAELLGITPEELKARLEKGKTMREIAEEQGIDLSELKPPKPPVDKPQGPMNRIHGFFQGLMKKMPWFNQ